MKSSLKSPTAKQRQSWMTFLKNHSKDIWSMDFLVVPTLRFKVLYVFLIVSHHRRKIEYFAITTNPTSTWVIQQIRNATPNGKIPKYLIHDNDAIFTSHVLQAFLKKVIYNLRRQRFIPLGKMVFVKERLVF